MALDDALMLQTLKQIQDSLDNLQEDISTINARLAVVETKAAIFGASTGTVVSIVVAVILKYLG
jgi:hypothetical protein